MNQQNMWFMAYILPQSNCQIPYKMQIINPLPVFSQQKVLQNINQQQKQEIMIKKSTNDILMCSSSRKKKNANVKEENQDSSYSLPIKQQYKTAEQKLGRNAASNILRLFTKLLKNSIFKQKYAKIKDKHDFDIAFKAFISWITGIGLNMNKYIRVKKIMNGVRCKPKYGRVLSMLYSVFEEHFARTAALTSSKTQAKNILPTLKQIRKIKKYINDAVIEGFQFGN